jgi:RNA polymerase sigma-70 factor (ECF subfamily)
VAETDRTTLRNLLLTEYGDFSRRLTRRLGSSEFAYETLQETFLRLERTAEIGPVERPRSYLFRIAVNIANDRRRAESRHLTESELDSLLEVVDDAPDPARTVEARSEIEALKRAVAQLPARRREIFLASRVEEIPHREIAKRYGVTVRTVEMELKQALEHCAERLKRNLHGDFAAHTRRSSSS